MAWSPGPHNGPCVSHMASHIRREAMCGFSEGGAAARPCARFRLAVVVYVPTLTGAVTASAMVARPAVMMRTRWQVNVIHAARVGAELGSVPATNGWNHRKKISHQTANPFFLVELIEHWLSWLYCLSWQSLQ